MIRRLFVITLCFLFLFSLPVFALADGVEGSVTEATVSEPDTSAPSVPDQADLTDINDNLSVIQSQLWFFIVIIVCFLVWKFFRWFF